MYIKGTLVKLLIKKVNFIDGKTYVIQDNLNYISNVTSSHPIVIVGENGSTDVFRYYDVTSVAELRNRKLNSILNKKSRI